MKNENDQNLIERSRELLANERTFLAWLRTSISLMGFGFVIVKFSLFLKQLEFLLESKTPSEVPKGASSPVGVIIVGIGVVVAILAFINFKKHEKMLKNNEYQPSSILSFLTTFIIVLGGIFLVWYLVLSV